MKSLFARGLNWRFGFDAGLEIVFDEGKIVLAGVSAEETPLFLSQKYRGQVKFFRLSRQGGSLAEDRPVAVHLENLLQLREERGDIYFLDRQAAKVLFVNFPATARYVLVRLAPRPSWFLALLGLLRRVRLGLVQVSGVISLETSTGRTWWLVVHHRRIEVLHTRLFLSAETGIRGLLDYLRREAVEYVVLRFFDKLPDLYRGGGGDLDLLVADKDEVRVKRFLQQHPGHICVDVWTPSRTSYNSITYYPPPLARRIIESAVDGPAGSRVPAPREAFLSFIYHILYHKGLFAGVPTRLAGLKSNIHPENDYRGVIARMAEKLGVVVEINMEALDEYLAREGWRPKLDTLAKLASRNEWVRRRFFSLAPVEEVGLSVFILKRRAAALGVTEEIVETIRNDKDFQVVLIKNFKGVEIESVANKLRGGVWHDATGGKEDFLPATALVVVDTHLLRLSVLNLHYETGGQRVRNLKRALRLRFDEGGTSLIHSTDNTSEAWEYIDVCFPGEKIKIRREIEQLQAQLSLSFWDRVLVTAVLGPRYLWYWFVRRRARVWRRFVRYLMRV